MTVGNAMLHQKMFILVQVNDTGLAVNVYRDDLCDSLAIQKAICRSLHTCIFHIQ